MSSAKQRLQAARTHSDALLQRRSEIHAEMTAIENNAAEVKQSVIKPSRDSVGFIAALLRVGKRPSKAELDQLHAESAQAAMANAQASEIEAAKQAAIAELQQEANAMLPSLKAAGQAVAEAHFEAVREEINEQLVPEFFKVCEALNVAYAKMIGASMAHCELAKGLREHHGLMAQAIGVEYPNRIIDIPLPGFTIGHASMPNLVRINATKLIEQAKAESLAKWR